MFEMVFLSNFEEKVILNYKRDSYASSLSKTVVCTRNPWNNFFHSLTSLGFSLRQNFSTIFKEMLVCSRQPTRISSRRVSCSGGGGGGWKTLCFKIGYSDPRRAESREGSSSLAESSWVT